MAHKKLTGIVTEDELFGVGCHKTRHNFAELVIYSCETDVYLVRPLENRMYEIILGYIRDRPDQKWK